MKRPILFLILFTSILAGCSTPQVTVATVTLQPTETPIPTPTLHPQFAEIQEQIADSGGRFTLQVDGTIQDGTQIIPGITVAPDGTITLAVDDEIVILDPDDMTFDEEHGISVKGYELDENGKWVEAESEAVQQAREDFSKYGYSTEGFEFREGQVTISVFDEDGIKVYERNIKSGIFLFDEKYVIEQARQQDLLPTDIEPRGDVLKAQGIFSPADPGTAFSTYFRPQLVRVKTQFSEQFGFDRPDGSFRWIMLNPDINAWGTIQSFDYKDPTAPRHLVYELGDGEESGGDITYTWANGDQVIGGTIYIVPLMPEK